MTGVYVMTPDYLAISVFDAPAGAGRPGGARPGERRGAAGANPGANGTPPPAATGAGQQPGGEGAARPGRTGGATQPGGIGATGSPQMKTRVSVILKKSGGAGGAGRP
jgi:hypothetical protein